MKQSAAGAVQVPMVQAVPICKTPENSQRPFPDQPPVSKETDWFKPLLPAYGMAVFFFHKMLRVKYVCKLIRLCLYTPATNEAKLMSKSVVAD
jgi:hypothetical protein